jgi:hypothetical protein
MKKLLKYFLYLVLLAGITIGALELFSTYTPSATIHTKAPVTTRHTILIHAPAEKVWRVMGNDYLHKIGWSGKAFGSFAIHNWMFTPQGNGTLVTVEESMEGWLVWLLKGTFQTGLDNSLTSWLAALKTEAEK